MLLFACAAIAPIACFCCSLDAVANIASRFASALMRKDRVDEWDLTDEAVDLCDCASAKSNSALPGSTGALPGTIGAGSCASLAEEVTSVAPGDLECSADLIHSKTLSIKLRLRLS